MGKIKKHAYCKTCEKPVPKPTRKKMDSLYTTIWFLIVISSLGLGLIPLLIYHFLILKRVYCPNCESIVDFYDTPEQFPGPKPPMMHIFDRIEAEKKEKEKEHEKEKKEEHIHCAFCHEKVDKDQEICPYCGVSVKE